MGLTPRFPVQSASQPGLPPRHAPAPARRAQPALERARRVAAMHRRVRHAAPPACPAPLLSRLHPPRRVCLPLIHLSCFLARSAAATAAAHARLRHRRAASPESARPATTARRRPLHLASSSASTSHSLCSSPFDVVRLSPAAIARQSTAVLAGAAWLRGSPLLAPFFLPFSRALAPPCPREPRARLPVPCRGRSRRTADEPRHRSAMRAVELPSELLQCPFLAHRVRLVAGSPWW